MDMLPPAVSSWPHYGGRSRVYNTTDSKTGQIRYTMELSGTVKLPTEAIGRTITLNQATGDDGRDILNIDNYWSTTDTQLVNNGPITEAFYVIAWVNANGEDPINKRVVPLSGGAVDKDQHMFCNLVVPVVPSHRRFVITVYIKSVDHSPDQ